MKCAAFPLKYMFNKKIPIGILKINIKRFFRCTFFHIPTLFKKNSLRIHNSKYKYSLIK